jgi:hypothetical protein
MYTYISTYIHINFSVDKTVIMPDCSHPTHALNCVYAGLTSPANPASMSRDLADAGRKYGISTGALYGHCTVVLLAVGMFLKHRL